MLNFKFCGFGGNGVDVWFFSSSGAKLSPTANNDQQTEEREREREREVNFVSLLHNQMSTV